MSKYNEILSDILADTESLVEIQQEHGYIAHKLITEKYGVDNFIAYNIINKLLNLGILQKHPKSNASLGINYRYKPYQLVSKHLNYFQQSKKESSDKERPIVNISLPPSVKQDDLIILVDTYKQYGYISNQIIQTLFHPDQKKDYYDVSYIMYQLSGLDIIEPHHKTVEELGLDATIVPYQITDKYMSIYKNLKRTTGIASELPPIDVSTKSVDKDDTSTNNNKKDLDISHQKEDRALLTNVANKSIRKLTKSITDNLSTLVKIQKKHGYISRIHLFQHYDLNLDDVYNLIFKLVNLGILEVHDKSNEELNLDGTIIPYKIHHNYMEIYNDLESPVPIESITDADEFKPCIPHMYDTILFIDEIIKIVCSMPSATTDDLVKMFQGHPFTMEIFDSREEVLKPKSGVMGYLIKFGESCTKDPVNLYQYLPHDEVLLRLVNLTKCKWNISITKVFDSRELDKVVAAYLHCTIIDTVDVFEMYTENK